MLTSSEQLTALRDAVLTASTPENTLHDCLAKLEDQQNFELSCALFESVVWRINIQSYWVLYRAAQAYRFRGRQDAAFLLSALADRRTPITSGAYLVCMEMFDFYQKKGKADDALDIFFDHARRFPDKPLELHDRLPPLLAATGRSLDPLLGNAQIHASINLRENKTIISGYTRRPVIYPVYGGLRAIPVEDLTRERILPDITVSILKNASILIGNDMLAVCDADGGVHSDLSTHVYPMLLKKHIDSLEDGGGNVEQIELDEAIIISDRYVSTNLAHFLLDGIPRLHIYELAGIDLGSVTVVGTEPKAEFQKILLEKFGVTSFLSTNRVAKVKVRTLWVSSNCRDERHPANGGASWALDEIRRRVTPDVVPNPRRIYVSRQDARGRRVVNEAEVIDLLKKYQFEVITPGEMSYLDQVSAFSSATHVVGTHGAGLANLVFCPPGAHVLEAFHPLYGTMAFAALAQSTGFNYSAMVARDGHSNERELNDPEMPNALRGGIGLRDIRIDISELKIWLDNSITQQGALERA